MRTRTAEPNLTIAPLELWARAAAASRRALLLDYDGTLAPYHTERDRAVPLPAALDALRRILPSPTTTLFVVSGRPVFELRHLLGQLPLRLVGEHGWEEWSSDGGLRVHPTPEAVTWGFGRAVAAAVRLALEGRLEIKRCSVVLHTRGLPEADARAVERACFEPWAEIAASTAMRLDRINGGLELRAARRDKGTAVRDIVDSLEASTFPVYVGDDETDEDAFREVAKSGFGLRVGGCERPTLALGSLLCCEAVSRFLDEWWRVIEGGASRGEAPEGERAP